MRLCITSTGNCHFQGFTEGRVQHFAFKLADFVIASEAGKVR